MAIEGFFGLPGAGGQPQKKPLASRSIWTSRPPLTGAAALKFDAEVFVTEAARAALDGDNVARELIAEKANLLWEAYRVAAVFEKHGVSVPQ